MISMLNQFIFIIKLVFHCVSFAHLEAKTMGRSKVSFPVWDCVIVKSLNFQLKEKEYVREKPQEELYICKIHL